ncbi:MAG: HEAT repeat domain-containing protein [Polyangiales bacterium]
MPAIRLVPALIHVLHDRDHEIAMEAARALGSIDDPRVEPALRLRLDRSTLDEERAVIAGALGLLGDTSELDYVRKLLRHDHPLVLSAALEAIGSLGGPNDAQAITELLENKDSHVSRAAILALARIGDGRALQELSQAYARSTVPAERADIEDALAAITARMELKGEEASLIDWSEVGDQPRGAERDKFVATVRGWWDFALGHVWLLFGSLHRAVARFESASRRRTGWPSPLIALAMSFARRDQYALALPAFRRAMAIDHKRVERNPIFVRTLAKSFLRRAEQVDREGKHDVARGLLGEVLTFDLRGAPSAVRFELQRLYELLRREDDQRADHAA